MDPFLDGENLLVEAQGLIVSSLEIVHQGHIVQALGSQRILRPQGVTGQVVGLLIQGERFIVATGAVVGSPQGAKELGAVSRRISSASDRSLGAGPKLHGFLELGSFMSEHTYELDVDQGDRSIVPRPARQWKRSVKSGFCGRILTGFLLEQGVLV
jgi:hypothetical protein